MDGSSVFSLIGILKVISSANLMRRVFFGMTATVSFTIIENRNGPKTVPWGTPLLRLTNSVANPSKDHPLLTQARTQLFRRGGCTLSLSGPHVSSP